jgi:hypothetical protein
MPDPAKPSVSARLPGSFPPRWGFFKGVLTGIILEVPILAAGVWLLARLGMGNRDASFMHILRLTTVFAGLAAIFTAGGVGRVAAHASVDKEGGRWRAVTVAARTHAAASAGLIIIAAIPHGHLPEHRAAWIALPLFGALLGAGAGAVIGVVCGGAAPVGIADLVGLARKPSEALRQLLDPEDLLRLGAAVRDRTTHLFGGMFEPAQKPPEEADKKPAAATATTPAPADAAAGDAPRK